MKPGRPRLRAVLPALFIVSASLVLADGLDPSPLQPLRRTLVSVTAPVLSYVQPVTGLLSRGLEELAEVRRARSDVVRLRDDNARLLVSAARGAAAEREVADLRALLGFLRGAPARLLTARVAGSGAAPSTQSLVIEAGRSQGLRPGLPVVAGSMLIGRTVQVHGDYATVLLLADRHSRVPVEVGTHGVRALLAGQGSGLPRLTFIGEGAVALGDVVTTSGVGGVFPRGIAIGSVASAVGDIEVLVADPARTAIVGVLVVEPGVFEPGAPGTAPGERGFKAAGDARAREIVK